MPENLEREELDTTDENDDVPYVEFDISVSPSDPTLELLAQKIRNTDIIIPFYQRKYVWKIEQASKLIESFLMGLPVPQVFLYVNEDDQLEVIDGQQRIMSVAYFFEGYFGPEDRLGRRIVFKLKGLSERSEYNGKTFSELSTRDQRKLRNSTLRAINIKQIKPHSGHESVFHIFERLNTGGTQLTSQEIRSAVYRGPIVAELAELNTNAAWQNILGLTKPDRSQKDVELVLRLFSLFEKWQEYEKPLLTFLNRAMDSNRSFDSPRAQRFKDRFIHAVTLVNQSIERPFRPRGILNSAVLEAVMVPLLEGNGAAVDIIAEKYKALLSDEDFLSTTTGRTTDTATLRLRITRAKEIFSDASR